ncbi:URC4/urg3 family protein [Mycolicibacterium mengxianglii]|uniref:URC4/urg3 family protein n=1 Tax=Mycolicibacterium mengxianglii TaxID=2736649 RepID=UPI0018D1463F|nr:URC4/urg3 family protein [Mycolicibacterium mengxianglii]
MTPSPTGGPVAELRTTAAIRHRCRYLLDRARSGESRWFTVEDSALPTAAALVADLTTERFPDLRIPFHSRWRHFEAGGLDRTGELRSRLGELDAPAQARALIDLAVVSVLLDAGSGPAWHYHEDVTGESFGRSEGLAVASWHAFVGGLFSSDPDNPLQADAAGLGALDAERLAEAFQVCPTNDLVGLDGRVQLLRRLSTALTDRGEIFGSPARPGGLFDALTATAGATSVNAHDILSLLLGTLSGIWLADSMIDGEPLGDCWPHPAVPGPGSTQGWVPFHKLSQWLTYSLLEPFEWAGTPVSGLDALTGLPEYRNGGLLLDTGAVALRTPELANRNWSVADELVVEWRALTVALLDDLAPLVRERLGDDAAQLPLACILEGGTWAAGRRLASQLRGGLPPLSIISDGTVF